MNRLLHSALFLLVVAERAHAQTPSPSATRSEGVTVTFLANEGVMLSAGGKKVFIDGLFLKYGPEFAMPADSTVDALQRARAPFDNVDLVLVTHRHGDHFHPAPVNAHLRANPRATLATSQQVIDSLRRYGPALDLPTSRTVARTMAPGTRRRDVINGITVEFLGIPHAGSGPRYTSVEHLAYIVELGGRRVLHTGDASLSEKVLAPFRLDTARIDVALIPTWSIISDDERSAIDRWIRPRQLVGIHVSVGSEERSARDVRAASAAAVTLVRSLETRRW